MKRSIAFVAVCIVAVGVHVEPAMADKVKAPRGWSDKMDNDVRVVSSKRAWAEIGPWEDLQGQTVTDWLLSLETLLPSGASLVESEGIKTERFPGTYAIMRQVEFDGVAGRSVLYACPGLDGSARLLQLHVESTNMLHMFKGAMFIEKVCEREPKEHGKVVFTPSTNETTHVDDTYREKPAEHSSNEPHTDRHDKVDTGDAPSITVVTNEREMEPVKNEPRSSNNTRTPDGLVELRGLIVMGIQPGGMFGTTEDFIALFDDGTFTTDLYNTFGKSVSASKQEEPSYWGRWRLQGKELQLQESGERTFEETRGNWVVRAGASEQIMSGCFGRLTTHSGGDYTGNTTVGVARTWCFWPDGRFTNSSTAFGSSSEVTMRTSSPKSHGRYYIDGYSARFVYADGHEINAAFGFANADKSHIVLNGKRFRGKKKK